jgi:hypothetical protein
MLRSGAIFSCRRYAQLLNPVNLDHAASDVAGREQHLKAVDGTKATIPETV